MQTRIFICEPDIWLGRQLGRKAYHVRFDEKKWTCDQVARALEPYVGEPEVFLYTKLAVTAPSLAQACEAVGFRTADICVQLVARELTPVATVADHHVRAVRGEDREAVVELATRSLRFSRFHQDPLISGERADALKAGWADNYFNGKRGDGMVVAEDDGRVVGFLLYLRRQGKMVIDLVAVDKTRRRMNFGTGLVNLAAKRAGASQVLAGTQAANMGALHFYQSLGFRIENMIHILHHHGRANRSKES